MAKHSDVSTGTRLFTMQNIIEPFNEHLYRLHIIALKTSNVGYTLWEEHSPCRMGLYSLYMVDWSKPLPCLDLILGPLRHVPFYRPGSLDYPRD